MKSLSAERVFVYVVVKAWSLSGVSRQIKQTLWINPERIQGIKDNCGKQLPQFVA